MLQYCNLCVRAVAIIYEVTDETVNNKQKQMKRSLWLARVIALPAFRAYRLSGKGARMRGEPRSRRWSAHKTVWQIVKSNVFHILTLIFIVLAACSLRSSYADLLSCPIIIIIRL
jgi:hypothetical protein